MELELRADDDDRPARVVDALAEQVLAEPALLALEHVAQGLQAVVAGAGDRAAAAAVVDQGVARLLEHPLLVADDDLGRAELEEPLQPVVAVDDAAVEVVEVRRREAAAVQLDHRPQVRRDHRQDREDHPLGARAGAAERLDEAQPLDRLLAALAAGGADFDVERARELVEVHPTDDVADRLRAHAGPEHAAAAGARAVLLVELPELGLAERQHRLEVLDLVARLADLVLEPGGLLLEPLALALQRVLRCRPGGRRSSARSAGLVGLALLELLVDALRLGRDDLAQARRRVLADLRRRPRRRPRPSVRTRSCPRSSCRLELGELRLEGLDGLDDRLGPAGALGLEVGPRAGERRVQLVLAAVELGAQLVLDLGELLARPCRRGPRTPPRVAAARALRASSSTCVTM